MDMGYYITVLIVDTLCKMKYQGSALIHGNLIVNYCPSNDLCVS